MLTRPLSPSQALYENMLVELPFAGFFLSKLLGTSADVDIHHLASLDPEVYRNLLFLKSYEGDVEELGLNFTVVNNDLGEAQVRTARPGHRRPHLLCVLCTDRPLPVAGASALRGEEARGPAGACGGRGTRPPRAGARPSPPSQCRAGLPETQAEGLVLSPGPGPRGPGPVTLPGTHPLRATSLPSLSVSLSVII